MIRPHLADLVQYNLGVLHSGQDSLECNYEEALKWFRSSALTGYADAQYRLGTMFEFGRGVAKDYQQAVSWYRLAASQGQVLAQHHLGVLHYEGNGVARTYPKLSRGIGRLLHKATLLPTPAWVPCIWKEEGSIGITPKRQGCSGSLPSRGTPSSPDTRAPSVGLCC